MGQNDQVGGRYELLGVLGQGAQATVYRGKDLQTGALVAVKVISTGLGEADAVLQRVKREQQVMQALAGTHAVQFIDLCQGADDSLCLVMELLEGEDLSGLLKQNNGAAPQLPIEQVASIVRPLVETLEKAHSVGIVHRDLKPSNIFLLDSAVGGGTRLLDFGLARLTSAEPLTRAGMVMGSPSYIAPEMWRGTASAADNRCDVYSLGVILFQMLAGRLPFAGGSLIAKMQAATLAERPSLFALRPELSRQVDIWVERALAIEPEERFPTVSASFGELLWALGLAPHPAQQRVNGLRGDDAERIRRWLERPESEMGVGDERGFSLMPALENIPLLSVEPLAPDSIDSRGPIGTPRSGPTPAWATAAEPLPSLPATFLESLPVESIPMESIPAEPSAGNSPGAESSVAEAEERLSAVGALPPLPVPPQVGPPQEVLSQDAPERSHSQLASPPPKHAASLKPLDQNWDAETCLYQPNKR